MPRFNVSVQAVARNHHGQVFNHYWFGQKQYSAENPTTVEMDEKELAAVKKHQAEGFPIKVLSATEVVPEAEKPAEEPKPPEEPVEEQKPSEKDTFVAMVPPVLAVAAMTQTPIPAPAAEAPAAPETPPAPVTPAPQQPAQEPAPKAPWEK